jgi:hypothetical protein
MATFDNLSYEANEEAKREKQDLIVKSVIEKYQERSEAGQEKYGTTLERNDLTLIQWLKHLQEELMDATLYLEKLKSELEQNPNFPQGHIITKESWDKADKISHEGFVYVKYTDLVVYK